MRIIMAAAAAAATAASIKLIIHDVELTPTNHVALVGPIAERSADEFSRKLFMLQHNTSASSLRLLNRHHSPFYVYIDSPGGSIDAGMSIINALPPDATCVVYRAYSMAFAIMQHCAKRVVVPHSGLMQHQAHFTSNPGLSGDITRLREYVEFTARQVRALVEIQAARIGVDADWFENRTRDEWWMTASDAIDSNCADYMTNRVTCSPELLLDNIEACPLLLLPF